MGEERGGVLLRPVGEEEGETVGRQPLHHLMDHALRHGQRAVADVDGPQEVRDGVHRHPDPGRRRRHPLDGFRLTELARLDGAEQGKEFVALDLRDAHVVQDRLGKGLEMLRGLHQPLQHRVRVDLEHPRHGTDPPAFR